MENETNEVKTFFSRCRCCLEYGYLKNMWLEYNYRGEAEVYGEMFLQCFSLNLESTQVAVNQDQICEQCIQRLRDACEFKSIVLKSQEEFVKVVKEEYLDEDLGSEGTQEFPYNEETVSSMDSYNAEDITEIEVKPDVDYEVEYLEDDADSMALFSGATGSQQTAPRQRRPRRTKEEINSKWPKKLPKEERRITYKQYTEEELRKGLEAVRSGAMTVSQAAAEYGIPAKTVRHKLTSEPENVLTDKTTRTTKVKLKHTKRLTIFCNTFNIDQKTKRDIEYRKLKAKDMLHTNIQTPKDKEQETLSVDIKSEGNENLVSADEVRTKYKALVKAKLKKEDEKSEISELEKHKDNIKIILQHSNTTMIKGYRSNGYACYFCTEVKDTPINLKEHNLEIHRNVENVIRVKYVSDLVIRVDITNLLCRLCELAIATLEELIDHLRIIHTKIIHIDIKNYIIPFKFDTNVLQCFKCMQEFKHFKLLSEHMSNHYRNYECDVCTRPFINKQSLQTHSYRHKNGVFKCSQCPKVFDTRPKKSVHERVIHALFNKTRKCAYCEERFSTKDLVQTHEVKVHGVNPTVFSCQACNKSYNSQSSLLTHRKRFHLMLRPHKCSYCDMAFFSGIELRSHTVTHTKSRDFKCDMCGKCFGTRCSLNQHVRGHLDDRRFRCEVCERAFVHRTAWKVHMRGKHGKIV